VKILLRYLRPNAGLVALSLLLAAVAQVLSMIDPIIFGKIIDTYGTPDPTRSRQEMVSGVLRLLALAVALALGSRLARAFQDYILRKVTQRMGMQVFNDGLKQTLRLPYQDLLDQRSGETLSILQKVRTDSERFIHQFINVVFATLVGVGFLVWYAITRSWLLVPVFVVGVLVLGGLTGLMSRRIKTIQRDIVRRTAALFGVITESLRNIELVKSLGLTYPEIRRMRGLTEQVYELEMEKVRRVRTLSFLQGTSINLLRQSILFILLWLIFSDRLSTGELIAMQFMSAHIFGPLQELGNILLLYRETEGSLHNFEKLMARPVETRPEDPVKIGQVHRIAFEDVVFRHRGASYNAINGISFTADLGETIAFVGPSGSGKSTLVKLLVGLYTPKHGRIKLNGVEVADIRYNEARRQFGFVTQDTQLFSGTIRENLRFVKPDATDEEMLTALHQAACGPLLERSGRGLDTVIGEGGVKLSGGEKQRLSIARALVRDPRLLIFDEATSALDSLTEEEITDTIRTLSVQHERITILIAHRLSTVMHADRIHVLEKGEVVETGTHEELLARRGLYYAMWRQQIGERAPSEPPRLIGRVEVEEEKEEKE
jgi:ATP-binding cassette subfamily B protein